jgi:putative acetyltransferase
VHSPIHIRKALESDLQEILNLFVNTIEQINSKDYSPEQIQAWKSSAKNTDRWKTKLASQTFVVAEINHKIVGFCSVEAPGYLDVLYVHAQYQRMGIAKHLYSQIENFALDSGFGILRAEVSITAKKFFEKQGFVEDSKQLVYIQNIALTNFKMSKTLF